MRHEAANRFHPAPEMATGFFFVTRARFAPTVDNAAPYRLARVALGGLADMPRSERSIMYDFETGINALLTFAAQCGWTD